ncbi:septal ring lytic transglycosylase RlpA family protein [Phytohabitans kaempferiae]|uniref:Probable endolytic peptidoglycan transglycosylase RlpA n=1 Tax=Phytohabitans kaempferiae TaxID=1620943 RepID=A0ABV6M6L9_9ACTN
MTGKHHRRSKASRASVVASAAVVGALLVGGGVGAVQLVGARSPETNVETTPPATTPTLAATSAAPTPTPSTTEQRASRGNARAAEPSPTPSRTEAPRATSSPKPRSEQVTATGSCGASFYHEPQPTANGEQFDPEALTAAHKTWAFNTRVRVTNPDNGKSVIVRINDRGPYIDGRCIDLSRAAFRAIASLDLGHIDVRYEILK